MSSIKAKFNYFDTFLYLPIISFFTVSFFIYGWDKKVITLFVFSILLIIFKYGFSTVKQNYKEPYFIILLITTLYGSLLYETIGYGSGEIRALIASTLFILFFPKEKIKLDNLPYLLFICATTSICYILYIKVYLDTPRGHEPINPIPYAIALCMMAVTCLFFFFEKKQKLLLISYILFTISIIISGTRGAIIPLTTASGLLISLKLLESKSYKKVISISSIGLALILFCSYNFVEARINKTIDEIHLIKNGNYNTSIGLRLQMWQISPDLISINPITGLGDSHKQELQNLYHEGKIEKSLANFSPAHYHNQYLDKLVKNGIIGFFAFLLVMYYPVMSCIKNRHSYPNKNASLLYLMAVTFSLACLTDTPFGQSFTLFPLLLGNYFFLISGYQRT